MRAFNDSRDLSDEDFFVDEYGEIRVEASVIQDNAVFGNGELVIEQDHAINTASDVPFVPTGLKSSKIVLSTNVQDAIEELDAKTISNQLEIDENEENISENSLLIQQLRIDTDNNTTDIQTEHDKNVEQDIELEIHDNKISNLEGMIVENASDLAIYNVPASPIDTTPIQIAGITPVQNFDGIGVIEESDTESGVFVIKNNINLILTNITTLEIATGVVQETPITITHSIQTRQIGTTT